MEQTRNKVSYLIFDVEAIADGDLIAKIRYPDESIDSAEAIVRYRADLIDATGKDVIPPTFMLPISVAVAKVDAQFYLLDLAVLDEPVFRPFEITSGFWRGWKHYEKPTLVTFNGRGYDLPVLELAAFRFGLSLPDWFNIDARSYDQSRNRYNISAHIDLMDLFSNFNATRMTGGLNLLANLIGKPGKSGMDGSMVQDAYNDGQAQQINDYCQADVLDTYFVFLRSRILTGQITLEQEQKIVDETRTWLEDRRENPAIQNYLDNWGEWQPPRE